MPAAAMAGAMLPRRVSSIAAARGGVVLTVRVVNPLLSCSLRPVDFTLDRSVDVVVVRPRSLFRRRRGCRPLGQVRVLFYPDRVPSAINTLTNKRVTNSQGEFFSLSLSLSFAPIRVQAKATKMQSKSYMAKLCSLRFFDANISKRER